MAAGPLNHLVLAAGSVADDLGYVALADISRLLDTTTDYRIVGGLMVTALAYRWNLGTSLYRETLDADLGVPPVVARDLDIAGRLKAAGYRQVAGDRFEKPVSDIPAGLGTTTASDYAAAIDVLVPAYTSRPRQTVTVAPDLVTTEVPALQLALARPPVELTLDVQRLNGSLSSVRLLFPDGSQRARPKSPRNHSPDQAHRHRRRMALPRDLPRRRDRPDSIQSRNPSRRLSDHPGPLHPERNRYTDTRRPAPPQQERRGPVAHPHPRAHRPPPATHLSHSLRSTRPPAYADDRARQPRHSRLPALVDEGGYLVCPVSSCPEDVAVDPLVTGARNRGDTAQNLRAAWPVQRDVLNQFRAGPVLVRAEPRAAVTIGDHEAAPT